MMSLGVLRIAWGGGGGGGGGCVHLGGVLGIPWTVCVGTSRKDPGMSLGSPRQHGGLCVK